MTPVSDVMTRGVRSLTPDDSLLRAAQAMQELDVGVLPVCEGERLVGMLTDRDITVRGVAQGCPADTTRVREVMSRDPQSCFEDEMVDDVVLAMRDEQIRRLPVLDRGRHLVGILTLGDVAAKYDAFEAGLALAGISEPAMPARGGATARLHQDAPDGAMFTEGSRIPGLLR